MNSTFKSSDKKDNNIHSNRRKRKMSPGREQDHIKFLGIQAKRIKTESNFNVNPYIKLKSGKQNTNTSQHTESSFNSEIRQILGDKKNSSKTINFDGQSFRNPSGTNAKSVIYKVPERKLVLDAMSTEIICKRPPRLNLSATQAYKYEFLVKPKTKVADGFVIDKSGFEIPSSRDSLATSKERPIEVNNIVVNNYSGVKEGKLRLTAECIDNSSKRRRSSSSNRREDIQNSSKKEKVAEIFIEDNLIKKDVNEKEVSERKEITSLPNQQIEAREEKNMNNNNNIQSAALIDSRINILPHKDLQATTESKSKFLIPTAFPKIVSNIQNDTIKQNQIPTTRDIERIASVLTPKSIKLETPKATDLPKNLVNPIQINHMTIPSQNRMEETANTKINPIELNSLKVMPNNPFVMNNINQPLNGLLGQNNLSTLNPIITSSNPTPIISHNFPIINNNLLNPRPQPVNSLINSSSPFIMGMGYQNSNLNTNKQMMDNSMNVEMSVDTNTIGLRNILLTLDNRQLSFGPDANFNGSTTNRFSSQPISQTNSFIPTNHSFKPQNTLITPTPNQTNPFQNNAFIPTNTNQMLSTNQSNPPMASFSTRPLNTPGVQSQGTSQFPAPFQNSQTGFPNNFSSNGVGNINTTNTFNQNANPSMFNTPFTSSHETINSNIQNPFSTMNNTRQNPTGISMLTAVEPQRQSYRPPNIMRR
jgi:hypothetical protein